MRTAAWASLIVLAALALPGRAAPPAPPASEVERKVAALVPTAAEDRWLQVPWRLNLMEACQEAERTGKPLYLWVMDGHPLGCT